jgi:transcriptional regulator with XRE-family HTH domain
MPDLNARIRSLIQDKNLSPSHFADEIGVQRSSISHILSGRNRPSLEIVQKIIRRFPDLTYEWLLGENAVSSISMRKGSTVMSRQVERIDVQLSKDSSKKSSVDQGKALPILQETTQNEEQKKIRVIKITLFYDDNTFEDFKPN